MRGSEGLAATRPYTGPAKPPSQPQPHSVSFKSPNHPESTVPGGRYGMSTLSSQSATKPRRVSSTPKSDGYISYKRFIQYDAFKDSKADSIARTSKARLAKPRSEKSASEMKSSQNVSGTSSSKLPRRSKLTLAENSDRTSNINLSQDEEDQPNIGTRSTTFIVDAQNGFIDSSSLEMLHRKIRSRHLARYNEDSSNKPDNPSDSKEQHPSFSKRAPIPKEVTSSLESQSERISLESQSEWRREREGMQVYQRQPGRELGREGARNPINENSLPARPKSAGQLRYCELQDSDESSLDGEIEIVDIDKELENDPEPSPYWTKAPPLQVPEVLIQTKLPVDCNSPPRTSASGTGVGFKGGRQQSQYPQQPPTYHHQHIHMPSPPHPSQSIVHMPLPPRNPRQRHSSGESDFSTFSDTIIKPSPPNERRRFLSEPEILTVNDRGVVGFTRHNVRARKGSRPGEEARTGENDATFPFPPSIAPRGRQRLYSDTMEHMLSQYTELGLQEEEVNSYGRPSRLPASHLVPNISGHVPTLSGTRDPVKPPRKLKPILKYPKNETEHNTLS